MYAVGDEFEGSLNGRNIVTLAYDRQGNALWSDTYLPNNDSTDYGWALDLGPRGAIYVVGQADRDPTSDVEYGFALIKYGPILSDLFEAVR